MRILLGMGITGGFLKESGVWAGSAGKRPKQKELQIGQRRGEGPFPPERIACVLEPGEGQGQRSEGKWPAEGAKERETGERLFMALYWSACILIAEWWQSLYWTHRCPSYQNATKAGDSPILKMRRRLKGPVTQPTWGRCAFPQVCLIPIITTPWFKELLKLSQLAVLKSVSKSPQLLWSSTNNEKYFPKHNYHSSQIFILGFPPLKEAFWCSNELEKENHWCIPILF